MKRRKKTFLLLLILGLLMGGILLSIKAHAVWNDTWCKTKLKVIYFSMVFYFREHKKLPDYQVWYDLLIQEADVSKDCFICPTKKQKGNVGTYVINKDFDILWNMPPDCVFVFEGVSGWNQSGGKNEIRPLHHGGCHVLFSNGDIKFIKEKDFPNLIWKKEEIKDSGISSD
ncbi:MAG: hypothetical protein WHS88_12575 [Anaerohalosphaeraceae bacterium]